MSDRQAAVPRLAEVFRAHGYEGASLAVLSEETGLGKGSLYNFFPGGKEEMAAAVLADVEAWFEERIFAPLRSDGAGAPDLDRMFEAVVEYFRSGERICLQGAFALGRERDRFGLLLSRYFEQWIDALAGALRATGCTPSAARDRAVDIVAGIQGAIVLSRATGRPEVFLGVVRRLQRSPSAART